MSPSYFDSTYAFAPFFDDVVEVRGVRPGGARFARSLPACVLHDGYAPALSEGGESAVRTAMAVVRPKDWNDPARPPRAGDVVRLADGADYNVVDVERSGASDWVLELKEGRPCRA